MSEPIDLAAWKEGARSILSVPGECATAADLQAEHVLRLIAAIEQKDAALLEIKAHCRYELDTSGMRTGPPRLGPSTAKWLEGIVDAALALTKKGGA